MKVNVSIHDFSPLFRGHEILFKKLKETGVDGVELVIGVKSRWSVSYYKKLSKKYDLPIVSLHQPIWAGLGLYFDEDFFTMAEALKVKYVTCHPLPGASFTSKRMRDYLNRLSQIKRKKGIEILVENMPQSYNLKLFGVSIPFFDQFFPLDETTSDVMSWYNAICEFGLNMTLDIDHLQLQEPQKAPFFKTIYPKIKNIHLSSFANQKNHLPLYMGDFKGREFVSYLEKHNYSGILTFEINYPGLISPFGYNFEAVKKSVDVVKDKIS